MSVLLILALWLVVGVAAVVVMHRRGHDAFPWAIVFLFLGPLALPLAFSADRHREPERPAPARPGALDVLVADDGSSTALDALETAVGLFAGRMTSLTLAAVLDLEAATTVRGRAAEKEAQERLDAHARRIAETVTVPVDTVVLHGEPAHTLERHAVEHGYELIVVGSRGRTRPLVLRGDVARSLLGCASVPVLVGPAGR